MIKVFKWIIFISFSIAINVALILLIIKPIKWLGLKNLEIILPLYIFIAPISGYLFIDFYFSFKNWLFDYEPKHAIGLFCAVCCYSFIFAIFQAFDKPSGSLYDGTEIFIDNISCIALAAIYAYGGNVFNRVYRVPKN